MAKHWVMTIGINHYRYLQSLRCAQQDAQALADWFVQVQKLPTDQVILLTDTSPSQQDQPTYPDGANLQQWLERLQKELIAPGDCLWVFFSGYGDGWQGEDYLLPIDGNPEDPEASWISVSHLLSRLKTLPTDHILVMFDINRSQSVRAKTQLGLQTAKVAKELGIATILSCQPEQFSQESSLVGHGLFTAAVLEGLPIYGDRTLGEFAKYLRLRLPQLSEHVNRPPQEPMVIATSEQCDRRLIPIAEPTRSIEQEPLPQTPEPSAPDSMPAPLPSPLIEPQEPVWEPDLETLDLDTPDRTPDDLPAEMFGWRALFGVVGLLVLIVLASGLPKRLFSANPTPSNSPSNSPSSPPSSPPTSPTATNPPNSTPSSPSPPISSTPSPSPTAAALKPAPAAPIDSARILEEARSYIKPTNASDANRAIERAMQIPQSDPRYTEAQRQIDIWSRDILNLANQRAQKGDYRSAITAAELIPRNRGAISTEAQRSIAQWKQRVR